MFELRCLDLDGASTRSCPVRMASVINLGVLRGLKTLPLRIVSLLDAALGTVFAGVLWAWARHRPVQIQEIFSARVGHLALEPELFWWRRETDRADTPLVVFFSQRKVANRALLNKWRQVLPFGPKWFLAPAFRASGRFKSLALRPTDWPGDSHRDLRPLDAGGCLWTFDVGEMVRGDKLARELGIEEGRPYVCLAVRDGAYLRATDSNRNWSYHDYRDSTIANYEQLANRLVDRGYGVIRMGRLVESAFPPTKPSVIDYANSPMRSDFLDLWLFAHCAFCISTSTGMDALATIQRRPMGFVNITSFGGLSVGRNSRLVMFKDLIDVETGQALDLLDDRRLEAMRHSNTMQIGLMGLAYRENSAVELDSFATEVVDLLEGRWQPTPEQIEVEQEFLSRIPGPLDYTQANFHISPSWLRSHSQVE